MLLTDAKQIINLKYGDRDLVGLSKLVVVSDLILKNTKDY